MGDSDMTFYGYETERDHGPGIENYECNWCRADRTGIIHCGECPHNSERITEYNRKYIY